ncbi:MAG TPA: hypothetical protein VKE41_08755 [Roseiflexaceae bacterium]|nr:hypothetical protein [Roseiflexaceae bacterium]
MTTELSACVSLQDGLRFVGTDRSGYTVQLDATAAQGGGTAPTPMELLLISLASCSAMDVRRRHTFVLRLSSNASLSIRNH